MERLAERGVPARPYFTPLHLQPLYRERFGFGEGDFPVTERVARTTLALPFSGQMTESQVARVCGALGEAVALAWPEPHTKHTSNWYNSWGTPQKRALR